MHQMPHLLKFKGPLVHMHVGGRGVVVRAPSHFHCVLHANKDGGGPDSMENCVRTKWKAPEGKF